MRVFVINQRNEPLMPCRPSKARKLLLVGKAQVVKRTPFTIQLLYATGETKQVVSLGVDAGSKTGGNTPNNLITLCETCHQKHHNGELVLNLKRGPSFRDAALMSSMRWAVYQRLKEHYPQVSITYGY